MIAAGKTYEQILAAFPDFTYLDIFRAAKEALEAGQTIPQLPERKHIPAQKRERYPRAYEKWTDAEDTELVRLIQRGKTVAKIAGQLREIVVQSAAA